MYHGTAMASWLFKVQPVLQVAFHSLEKHQGRHLQLEPSLRRHASHNKTRPKSEVKVGPTGTILACGQALNVSTGCILRTQTDMSIQELFSAVNLDEDQKKNS